MGISVEFNPDLALRDISCFKEGKRLREECLPEKLDVGKLYDFLKSGQRNYWLEGELPLLKTEGNANLSRPLASIVIEECTHFVRDGRPWTKGKFRIVAVFDLNSSDVHFESYARKV